MRWSVLLCAVLCTLAVSVSVAETVEVPDALRPALALIETYEAEAAAADAESPSEAAGPEADDALAATSVPSAEGADESEGLGLSDDESKALQEVLSDKSLTEGDGEDDEALALASNKPGLMLAKPGKKGKGGHKGGKKKKKGKKKKSKKKKKKSKKKKKKSKKKKKKSKKKKGKKKSKKGKKKSRGKKGGKKGKGKGGKKHFAMDEEEPENTFNDAEFASPDENAEFADFDAFIQTQGVNDEAL